ncbi:MAG: pilus assembly protein TadB [Paenibacillus sp.]|nr:pilus assembly protein TadB [Paenibacillus sp.]
MNIKRSKPRRWNKLVFGPSGAAIKSQDGLQSYHNYDLSRVEVLVCLAVSSGFLFAVGLLFYGSFGIALILSLGAVFSLKYRKIQLAAKRKEELKRQFKQALYALSTALGAGRSVESAFRECIPDLQLLYPGHEAMIIRELEIVNRRVAIGEPMESALRDFGNRTDIPDIIQFAEVFATCKRTGGDLVEVLRKTSNMIGEKLEMEQDIAVLIAQKRFEAKALSFIPFGIIAFLAWSSPDYMTPLYEGFGRIVMTFALLLLALCFILSRKIMNIRI